MTTQAVAQMLGISERTLRGWRTQDPDPGPRPTRVRGMVRYRLADVEAWLVAQQGGEA